MEKLVWVNRIYSKNFVSDFLMRMKNIIGGRLISYEKMLDQALKDTNEEFNKKYPNAMNIKIQVESFIDASISITIYGVIYDPN